MSASACLRVFEARPEAAIRVFALPYAGGSASLFRQWSRRLPREIELVAVQYPGRENRFAEPALREFDPLLDHLVAEIRPFLDRPFAFYGHSMGALLAYAVSVRIASEGGPAPLHLFAGAAHAPGEGTVPTSTSPGELAAHVERYFGGLPAELREQPELMLMQMELLAADFAAYRTYRARPRPRPPLHCPVTAIAGADDAAVPVAGARGWERFTTAGFQQVTVPGPHLFIRSGWEPVADTLVETLRPAGSSALADSMSGWLSRI